MKPSLDLNLPTGPELPPPPPRDRETIQAWQEKKWAEFYASPHYEAWLERTSEEMRHATAFVWID